jgi:hypothetical protein
MFRLLKVICEQTTKKVKNDERQQQTCKAKLLAKRIQSFKWHQGFTHMNALKRERSKLYFFIIFFINFAYEFHRRVSDYNNLASTKGIKSYNNQTTRLFMFSLLE